MERERDLEIREEKLDSIAIAYDYAEGRRGLDEVTPALFRVGPLPVVGAFEAVRSALEKDLLPGWSAVRIPETDHFGHKKWQVVSKMRPSDLSPFASIIFCPKVGGWLTLKHKEP